MSNIYKSSISGPVPPAVPTSFVTNSGTAVPAANILNVLGSTVAAGSTPFRSIGSGNTVTYQTQISQAIGATDATKIGLAAFNSADFTVDANGFVALAGGGTASVLSLSDDVNTKAFPNAGNIQLVGHVVNQTGNFSTTVAGTNLININPMTPARWIVDAKGFNGTHTTIQAAINAATAGDTIAIVDGIYTENPVLKAGISLVSFDADGFDSNVTILGKVQANFSGNCSLCGINLKTNNDYCLEVTGSSACIVRLVNCQIEANNNTAIHYTTSNGNSFIEMYNCFGEIDTTGISYFTFSGSGGIRIVGGLFTNNGGSTTACTASGGGAVSLLNTYFGSPITFSGSAVAGFANSTIPNALILGGSGTHAISNCALSDTTINTGSLILSNSEIGSVATHAITGSGTLKYSNLSFTNSSSNINVSTQTPLVTQTGAIQVTTPGAYPYTAAPQDGVILVDTSVSRTINLPASPATGLQLIIKDNVGSAGANNITVSPAAGNIDGAASLAVNINYASITVVYNGTQWNVI